MLQFAMQWHVARVVNNLMCVILGSCDVPAKGSAYHSVIYHRRSSLFVLHDDMHMMELTQPKQYQFATKNIMKVFNKN